MEKRPPLKGVDNVTVLYTNEVTEDSDHSMLEPVDSSNKENGFSKPELGSTKAESLPSTESTIPRTKPRLSLLQEFDPLCACKETVEGPHVRVSDDDFRDTDPIAEEKTVEADETEKEVDCVCVSTELSESPSTLTTSVENSDTFITVTTAKIIREVDIGPNPSEEIIRKVEYDQCVDSVPTDETINITIEKSDIFYPTVEHPDEHITEADASQYLDTLSTTQLDDTHQSFQSTDEKRENSQATFEVDSIRLAAIRSISSMTDTETRKIMSDITAKMEQQQEELSHLKLELNAAKQAKASLELELTQKDEVILKSQAELIKIEQIHKHELKQIKEQLKTKVIQKGGDDLEEQLKECKSREAKAIAELTNKSKANLSLERSLDQYEKQLAKVLADHSKEVEEHEVTKRHLASLELAFSDVHSKYEKSKDVIQGYVTNEATLVTKLELALATNVKHEEKYESLKTHAKNQIDKSNLEILSLKEKDEVEINKMKAIIKRLEIKCCSLEVSLQQKIEECEQLSALCDEVTGQKV